MLQEKSQICWARDQRRRHKDRPEKVESVQRTATPQNVSDLQRLRGMVNQLGRSILHLTEKTKPLRDILSKKNHNL